MEQDLYGLVVLVGILTGIISAVAAWGASLITYGSKVGRFESRISEVEKHNTELAVAMAELKRGHDSDMKAVWEFFRTPSGGQKFMTFTDHDGVCEKNARTTVQSLKILSETLLAQTAELARLSAEVRTLTTAVAILQDRRNTSRIITEDIP